MSKANKNRRGSHLRDRKSNLQMLAMCLPAMLKLLVFAYVPMVGIVMAFQDYSPSKGFFGSEWVGFRNFAFFFKSNDWLRLIENTVVMNLLFIFVGLVVSIVLALIMYELHSRVFLKLSQTFFFFPYFVSWPLVGLILLTFLNSDGIITNLIEMVTGKSISFYMESQYWRLILLIVNVWKGAGVNAIIYYANMMSIDKEFYEAAELDGANRLQCAWYITLPEIKTMAIVLTVMAIGNIIRADFGMFYYVPRNSSMLYPATDVIDTYVFRAINQLGDFSMGSAVGLFQSVVGFIMILVTNLIVRKVNREAALF